MKCCIWSQASSSKPSRRYIRAHGLVLIVTDLGKLESRSLVLYTTQNHTHMHRAAKVVKRQRQFWFKQFFLLFFWLSSFVLFKKLFKWYKNFRKMSENQSLLLYCGPPSKLIEINTQTSLHAVFIARHNTLK